MSEILLNFGKMPVFMGCVETSLGVEEDIFCEMNWGIKDDSTFGVIDPPHPSLIYMGQHNELIGGTWGKHLVDFSEFISSFNLGEVLEIGGGHCKLVSRVATNNDGRIFDRWDIIEPNPLNDENIFGQLILDFFPSPQLYDKKFDTIIHSHVLEHVPSPINFLKDMYSCLKESGQIIMSFPNMEVMAKNIDLNLLMFEHLTYLTLKEVKYMATCTGFEVSEIEYFYEHSIFVRLIKSELKENNQDTFYSTNTEIEIQSLVQSYSNEINNKVDKINKFMNLEGYEFYLFGAHIFTQYLIALGMNTNNIAGILDNSIEKQGKRLYGSELNVLSPNILNGRSKIALVLPMGNYEYEVIEQLKDLQIADSLIYSLRNDLIINLSTCDRLNLKNLT
jgi:predicted SAM-dependent methyltransferase